MSRRSCPSSTPLTRLTFAVALAIAAAGSAQKLRVTPLKGEAVVLRDWSISEGHVRGRLDARGDDFSISLRRAWILEPMIAPVAASKDGPYLVVRSGPKVFATLKGGDADTLRFTMRSGGEGAIPRTFVQAVRGAQAPSDGNDRGFAKAAASPPGDGDLLFVLDKKRKVRRFPARISGIEGESLVAELRGDVRQIPLNMIYGFVFGQTSGVEAPADETRGQANLRLHDGRVVRGRMVSGGAGKKLSVLLKEGLSLAFSLGEIREIEIGSDKLVYLSRLEPARTSKQTSVLGRAWPILRDKGLGGVPLQLANRTYRRGLLLVPSVKLHFTLPRAFDRLLGEVGIPRARFGSARLRFLVGDKPVGSPIQLVSDGKPIPLDLQLGGAKVLTVELSATADLDVGSQVVLGDLRVVVD